MKRSKICFEMRLSPQSQARIADAFRSDDARHLSELLDCDPLLRIVAMETAYSAPGVDEVMVSSANAIAIEPQGGFKKPIDKFGNMA